MTASDELTQRAIFDEPGAANLGLQRTSWDDVGGPMLQPPDSWEINRRVRAELHALSQRPALRQVVETAGRRASDRLAVEAQHRRDDAESAHALADTPRASPWLVDRPSAEERRRERATAGLPRDGDYPGTGVDRDAAEHRRWRDHFAEQHDIGDDPHEAWWSDDQDDLHDLIPEQRTENTQ